MQQQARRTALTYGVALVFGLLLVFWFFPLNFLFPMAGQGLPPFDAPQHIVAQRYFIREPWGWPLLQVHGLMPPNGINIAFLDAIPLQALILKALAPWLPGSFHGINLWYGISWLLQPAAALFCIRSTGERRLAPSLAFCVIALCMPAWYVRYGHAALNAHFLLLLSLGLSLRIVLAASAKASLWCWAAVLTGVALLVHPYLAMMVLAVLAGAPATIFWYSLRASHQNRLARTRAVLAHLGGLVACVAVAWTIARGLGYFGAAGGVGYGSFALNIASPFWPHLSGLLPSLAPAPAALPGVDGFEGYNWLGLGLLAALLLGIVTRPVAVIRGLDQHAGLAAALLALTLLSLSFHIGFMGKLVLDLGPPPDFLQQFRASGRFFWPVAYALALASVLLLAGLRPMWLSTTILAAVMLLQILDTQTPRRGLRQNVESSTPQLSEAALALRAALPGTTHLTLLPSWSCAVNQSTVAEMQKPFLEMLGVASERGISVNTMYVARWTRRPRCEDAARLAAPLFPGEVRVVLPALVNQARNVVPGAAERCREHGGVLLCKALSNDPSVVQPTSLLPPLASPLMTFSAGETGTSLLSDGWSTPEAWGVWSDGKIARLEAWRPAALAGALQLEFEVLGFPPESSQSQSVQVLANDSLVARWIVPGGGVPSRQSVSLPPLTNPDGEELQLEFRIADPTSPAATGRGSDPRSLGLALLQLLVLPAR